jgi:hypothetical protein
MLILIGKRLFGRRKNRFDTQTVLWTAAAAEPARRLSSASQAIAFGLCHRIAAWRKELWIC